MLSCLTFLDHNFVLLPGGKGKKKGERGGKREGGKKGLKTYECFSGRLAPPKRLKFSKGGQAPQSS